VKGTTVTVVLMDHPRVQALLLAAYDLLAAAEHADPMLVTDEIVETAEAFREVIENR
jgi:hypothetical protein